MEEQPDPMYLQVLYSAALNEFEKDLSAVINSHRDKLANIAAEDLGEMEVIQMAEKRAITLMISSLIFSAYALGGTWNTCRVLSTKDKFKVIESMILGYTRMWGKDKKIKEIFSHFG